MDNAIALQYKPTTELEPPLNMMAKLSAIRGSQQENAMRQAQMENYRSEIEKRNAMLPFEQAKARSEQETARIAQDSAASKLVGERLDLARRRLEGVSADAPDADAQYIAWHKQNHRDPVLADYFSQIGVSEDDSLKGILSSIYNPDGSFNREGLRQKITESKLGVDATIKREDERNKPTAIALGGTTEGINARGETVWTRKETESPNSKATNARLANAGITAQSHPLVSQAILDGRIPLARVNSRTAALFESALQINPQADINAIGIDQIGAGAGARTAGTTQANISIASDEARRMIGVARTIIPKVNPSEYPSLNAVQNAISKGTGGVEIVQLNTALNSLINSYARAINPRGTPTVSDKAHAREIVNSAMSTGQLEGTLAVMEQEMDAALAAANEGRARGTPKEGATAAPAATGGGDLVAAARAELARRRGAQK